MLIVVLIPCALCAGKLEVAKKGTYVYWFTYKNALGEDQMTQPERFKGRSGDIDTTPLGPKFSDAKLHVMDKATGNTAIIDYVAPEPGKEPKPIKLEEDDFEFVRAVRLRIVSEGGAPIESAIIDITDGEGRPLRALVTPADQGVASFEDVASGDIAVKVHAKGLTKTIDSDITIPEKRKTAGFEEEIRVAGDVNTLPKLKPEKRRAGETPAGRERPGPSSGLIFQSIAALVFLVVVIAVIYAIVKSRGITAQEALKKMGVQVGSEQAQTEAQPAAPPVDPNICPFCGGRKDAAGNCACSVTPGAAPAAPVQPGTGAPRLVGTVGPYAGHIFELRPGAVTVSRESGDIVLSNDHTVSRRHATITESGGEYTICDDGSSNGTFVNGARIAEQRLSPGDEVQIGSTKFRFEAS